MQMFAKHKEQVQIVTNERSKHLHESFQNVATTYDPNKYEPILGKTFLFDDCFADGEWMKGKKLREWMKGKKLRDWSSYPRSDSENSTDFHRGCVGIWTWLV